MNEHFLCKICGGKSKSTVNSYKHFWFSCNDCGNVFRKRKEKYLIPSIIPSFIGKQLFPKKVLNRLYAMDEVIKDDSLWYDYYKDSSALNIKNTKWANALKNIKEIMDKYNIDLNGKTVLDISGGPGFAGKEFGEIAKKVVVTEFSQIAVDAMIKNLDIEAIKFDYNADKIHEVINDKFDVVFINYSINFCNDLESFVSSLRNIVLKGSIVYISFVPPTLGCCMRWQHNEYTYNVLFHPETVGKIFAEENFHAIAKITEEPYYYSKGFHCLWKIFTMPYTSFFIARARRKNNNINRELIQKNIVHIYKYQ